MSHLMQIENELDELLLPYKIDLSLMQKIESRELIDHIRRVGVVFDEKQPSFNILHHT